MADAALQISASLTGVGETIAEMGKIAQAATKASADVAKETAQATQVIVVQQQKQQEAIRQTTQGYGGVRQAVSSFAATLSGTSALLSIFARNNEDLQRKLEVVAIATGAAAIGVRTLGSAWRFATAATVALGSAAVAAAAALGPVGLTIAAVAAAVSAAIAIFLNFDSIQRAVATAVQTAWNVVGDFFATLFASVGEMARGLGQILLGAFTFDFARIQDGLDQLKAGLGDLGQLASDVGQEIATGVRTGVRAAQDLIADLLTDTKKAQEQMRAGWVAYAEAVLAETELEQRALIRLNEEAIAHAARLRQADLQGWVAYADAVFAETERAQRATVELSAKAAAEEARAREAIEAGWVAHAEAVIAATEEEQRAVVALQDKLREVPEIFRDIVAAAGATGAEMQQAWTIFSEWFGSQMLTIQQVSQTTWQMFSQGVGQAVASAIVFGTSLSEAFKKILQNIAASVISMLIQIGLQYLASAILNLTIGAKTLAAELGRYAATTYAAAFAAVAGIPFIGPFIAPGVAAGAVAAMLAGSTASHVTGSGVGLALGMGGVSGLAQGGLEEVEATGTWLLHRGERVLSRRQNVALEAMLDEGAGPRQRRRPVIVNLVFNSLAVFDELTEDAVARRLKRALARV